MRDSDENTRVTDQGPWARTEDVIDGTTRMLAGGASWSGHERNHLFFGGLPDNQFARVSGITGMDDPGDSRAFATLDIDQDGWLDVALVNVSAPRLRILRNEIGSRPSSRDNRFLAIQFMGGNRSPLPSTEWSSRDGLGSYVELELADGRKVYREHRIDDGFKAQNTATMIVGIGNNETVRALNVRWLSGVEQTVSDVAAGQRVVVYENPSDSPSGEAFVVTPYRNPEFKMSNQLAGTEGHWRPRFLPTESSTSTLTVKNAGQSVTAEGLILYTAVATWCDDCTGDNPDLQALRTSFSQDALAMYGLPIDREDPPDLLKAWSEDVPRSYHLLTEFSDSDRSNVENVLREELRDFGRVPASVVTDSEGRVLLAKWGVPTVSEIRQLLWKAGAS